MVCGRVLSGRPTSANPAALVFTADAGAAGKYTIQAKSAGAVKTLPIDSTSSVPSEFRLPGSKLMNAIPATALAFGDWVE